MAKNVGAATALLLLIVALLSAHADAAGDRKLLTNPPSSCNQAVEQSGNNNGNVINIAVLNGNTNLFYQCCTNTAYSCCANNADDAKAFCLAHNGSPFGSLLPINLLNLQCVIGVVKVPINIGCVAA